MIRQNLSGERDAALVRGARISGTQRSGGSSTQRLHVIACLAGGWTAAALASPPGLGEWPAERFNRRPDQLI